MASSSARSRSTKHIPGADVRDPAPSSVNPAIAARQQGTAAETELSRAEQLVRVLDIYGAAERYGADLVAQPPLYTGEFRDRAKRRYSPPAGIPYTADFIAHLSPVGTRVYEIKAVNVERTSARKQSRQESN